jgi:hypothetical protein
MANPYEQLAEILEPAITEALCLWENWEDADLSVVADNVATDLIKAGVKPPQDGGRTITDTPTGGRL